MILRKQAAGDPCKQTKDEDAADDEFLLRRRMYYKPSAINHQLKPEIYLEKDSADDMVVDFIAADIYIQRNKKCSWIAMSSRYTGSLSPRRRAY